MAPDERTVILRVGSMLGVMDEPLASSGGAGVMWSVAEYLDRQQQERVAATLGLILGRPTDRAAALIALTDMGPRAVSALPFLRTFAEEESTSTMLRSLARRSIRHIEGDTK
jgi:hypothetical protein